ncbi:MAG: hypothetical protein AAB888_00200 [Patescibacteria group bacterium]
MDESNMQPGMMKNGGNKNGLIVAIIAIAIIVIGFFVFNDKNSDTKKDAMMKNDEAMMEDTKDMMKKDGEAMMEKGDAMAKQIVKYTDAGFAPTALEIASGETVTFVNESSNQMWIASAIHPTHELLPEFDQMEGTPKGSMYSFTFTKPGVWKFHDHLNPAMKGSVTVK